MKHRRHGMKAGLVFWLGLLLLQTAGVAEEQNGADERAIGETYREWVEATNAGDLERWASFLAPGAVFLPPNSPALLDEKAIRSFYAGLFRDDRFALDCRQERVEVAEARDFAWSTGHCEATFTGPDGSEAHDRSKWAKVWKRRADGAWKCTLNSWSSTLVR